VHRVTTAPGPRPTPSPPPAFGFNAYTSPESVAKQRAVGVTTTRLFVAWAGAEPLPGRWVWANYDTEYQQVLAGGLRPLIVADSAPCWASGSSGCNPLLDHPPAPGYDQQWIAYVKALVARYPQAIGIEIWNEPNLTSQWWPAADPYRYTALLHEAYTAVKSVAPTMPVISGGLLLGDGYLSGGPGFTDQKFLTEMYQAGAAQWMDALGVHVYPADPASPGHPEVWDPSAMQRWLAAIAAVRSGAGAPAAPIWVTEMGVSTATQFGFPVALTRQQQAADLLDMVQMARANPLIRVAMIDTLQDAYPNPALDLVSALTSPVFGYNVFFNGVSEGLGVYTARFVPKPAACGVSRTLGGALNC
jgi:hypothetical protein